MIDETKLKTAIFEVNKKFKYKEDDNVFGDDWCIMDGSVYAGDCEDYSLTVLYHYYDKNIWKMFYGITITREFELVHARWKTTQVGHLFTRYENTVFDNIVRTTCPHSQYEKNMKFDSQSPYSSIIIPLKFFYVSPIVRVVNRFRNLRK